MSSWDNLRAPQGALGPVNRIRTQNTPIPAGQTAQQRAEELQRSRADYEQKQYESFLQDGPESRQQKLEQAKFFVVQQKRAPSSESGGRIGSDGSGGSRRAGSRPMTAGSSSGRGRDYAQARNRTEIESRRRVSRRPQSAGGVLASRQPNTYQDKDGWVAQPKFETRSEMMAARRKAKLPNHTFDVDGDGSISQEDFR